MSKTVTVNRGVKVNAKCKRKQHYSAMNPKCILNPTKYKRILGFFRPEAAETTEAAEAAVATEAADDTKLD